MSEKENTLINLLALSNAQSARRKQDSPKGIKRNSWQVICENVDIFIDRDGNWYHQGSIIRRVELLKLFASALRRDEIGSYWLITPAEMAQIEVEDAPFIAVELFRTGGGQHQNLSLRTNLNAIITVDVNHPIQIKINHTTGEPSPYVVLDGNIEAKITRAVYYELVSLGEEKHQGSDDFGIWSKETFFSLGSLNTKQ